MATRRSAQWWASASLVAAAAMALTAWATAGLHVERGISPLWPPAGIAIAWLMATGLRGVPAVVLGRIAGTLLIDGWWLADGDLAMQTGRLVAVVVAYTGAALVLRRIGIHHARLREFGWFAFVGVLLAPLVAAVLSSLSDAVTLGVPFEDAVESARTFWVGDAIGVLTVAPPLLLIEYRTRRGTPRTRLPTTTWRRVETALQALAVVLAPILALALDADGDRVTPMLALAVLPLVWVAVRQDLLVAALGVLTLNLTISITAAARLGPGAELVELQMVMLAGALAAYYVAALSHTTDETIADLIESEVRYRHLTQTTPDLVVHLDLDGNPTAHNDPPWSHGAAAWTAVLVRELRDHWPARVAALRDGRAYTTDESLHPDVSIDIADLAAAEEGLDPPAGPADPTGRSTGRRQVEVRLLPQHAADGELSGVVAVATDRTAEREATSRLAWEQHHDPLTGLANASAIEERLTSALHGRGEGSVALAIVDIDHFRIINHSLGHAAGDLVLRAVGHQLRRAARPGDLVARTSGDGFAVALQLRDGQDPRRAVEHLATAVRSTDLPEGGAWLTACVGVAVASPHTRSAHELLRDADTAMNAAKERGPDSIAVFDDVQRSEALHRRSTVAGLHRALHADELVVHFQPVVSLHTGTTTAVEALVRWQTPERLRYPDEFIDLAERVGIDVALGTRVADLAIEQMASWHRRIERAPRPLVSVNVTARQLLAPGFTEALLETCHRHGLDTSALSLELTERSVMGDPTATIPVMERLRDEGIGVALDDFGTGYSSIAYLHKLPIDMLKIDRSFVAGLPDEEDSRRIVGLIVELATGLGLGVTAEGVETDDQRCCLLELGCSFGQGYLFARPTEPELLFPRMPVPTRVEPVERR